MSGITTSYMALLTGAYVLLTGGTANAEEVGSPGVANTFQLAEIVLPAQPDSTVKTSKSAATARSKAKAYQESASGSTPVIVAPEEEEESLLGPRRQPESSGAAQNRNRARQYQQGQTAGAHIPASPSNESGSAGSTISDRAHESRAKARAYVSTDNTVVIERIGSDGIPIVACGKLIANVAGRIGDDMQPGGIFFITRDNKPFKVRCAQ